MKKKQPSASGIGTGLMGALSGLGSLLTNFILVLVYIFLFIFFRSRLKNFVIKLVSQNQRKNAIDTINKAQKVSQKYLTGLFMMIVCLWVMYSIGFSIVGVKNPFFFAILCGLLEIVPFVGNSAYVACTGTGCERSHRYCCNLCYRAVCADIHFRAARGWSGSKY